MKALIFDCDGVLVDTERDGHRVAFNRAFAAAGIDAEWDVDLYGELLKIAGGKERMTHFFNEAGWPDGQTAATLIPELHKRKTAIFTELIASGELPLRPGITRIIDEAHAAGVRLGVCTTSDPKAINGVLDLMGAQRKGWFEIVLAGDVVAKKKPNPEIYNLAKHEARPRRARLRRDRGQPQRPARRVGRRHALPHHDERLHARRGLRGSREGRARARRPAERSSQARGFAVAGGARARPERSPSG